MATASRMCKWRRWIRADSKGISTDETRTESSGRSSGAAGTSVAFEPALELSDAVACSWEQRRSSS
eukprot:2265736-Prymnesium_polylepis.2